MSTIADASVRYVALPTGMKSFLLPNGHRTPTELSALVVQVTDGDGAVGRSMLWAQRDRQLPAFEAALRYVSEAVVGAAFGDDAEDVDAVVAAMRQAAAFLGPSEGAVAFGVSGMEMALQDLRLRRLGQSLSASVGRRRSSVRAYQTGLMLPSTIDELVEEAEAILARGIRAVKMIVGKPTIDEDVERIRAVKDALPADASLMVDALQRWSLAEALAAVEKLAGLDLVWLEDPIRHDDLRGYRQLVAQSPVPVATGETCFSTASFQALLDAGVPYVIAELERTGGASGWLDVAQLVGQHDAVMLPHIYPDVSAQLMATTASDQGWWEYVPWFDALLPPGGFTITDGHVDVPDTPGSGFAPTEEALDQFSRTPWLPLGP